MSHIHLQLLDKFIPGILRSQLENRVLMGVQAYQRLYGEKGFKKKHYHRYRITQGTQLKRSPDEYLSGVII